MVDCKENYKFDVGVKGLKTEYSISLFETENYTQ